MFHPGIPAEAAFSRRKSGRPATGWAPCPGLPRNMSCPGLSRDSPIQPLTQHVPTKPLAEHRERFRPMPAGHGTPSSCRIRFRSTAGMSGCPFRQAKGGMTVTPSDFKPEPFSNVATRCPNHDRPREILPSPCTLSRRATLPSTGMTCPEASDRLPLGVPPDGDVLDRQTQAISKVATRQAKNRLRKMIAVIPATCLKRTTIRSTGTTCSETPERLTWTLLRTSSGHALDCQPQANPRSQHDT